MSATTYATVLIDIIIDAAMPFFAVSLSPPCRFIDLMLFFFRAMLLDVRVAAACCYAPFSPPLLILSRGAKDAFY